MVEVGIAPSSVANTLKEESGTPSRLRASSPGWVQDPGQAGAHGWGTPLEGPWFGEGGRCRGKRGGAAEFGAPGSPPHRPAGPWSLRDARKTGPTPGGRKGGVRMACGIQNAAKRRCRRGFAGEKRAAARREKPRKGRSAELSLLLLSLAMSRSRSSASPRR